MSFNLLGCISFHYLGRGIQALRFEITTIINYEVMHCDNISCKKEYASPDGFLKPNSQVMKLYLNKNNSGYLSAFADEEWDSHSFQYCEGCMTDMWKEVVQNMNPAMRAFR